MANSTAPSAKTGVQPKALHEGVQSVRSVYSASHSHSPTDVIQMVKVPNGAIIDEIILSSVPGSGSAPAVVVFQVGDGDDPNRFASLTFGSGASAGAGLVARANLGLGYEYSFSDAEIPQYDTIDLTVDAGVLSAGHVIQLTVLYHVDG